MTRPHSRGKRAGARGAGLAVTVMLAAALAGCGPADTGLQRDTAQKLQELVLGVSQAAAAADHAAALKTLDSLETDVASAAGSGRVSEERRRSIVTSITAVRADLKAATEAAAAAAKAADEAAAAAAEAAKTKADAEAAAQAAQEYTAPVVPVPAPAPAPEPAKGEGKGKNKNG
ncbi:UNVERIFIED_ORG: membrane protein involved in colicin uptake [Arthrobacter sp. UYEF10]